MVAKIDNLLSSIERLHDKSDEIKDKVHNIDKKVCSVEGQLKIMNGQVQRNKEDIKGIRKFVTRVATGIGAGVSGIVALISNFWSKMFTQ